MFMSEASKVEAEKLRAKKHPWHSTTIIGQALGSKNGVETLYVTRSPSLSSLLKPDVSVINQYRFFSSYAEPADGDYEVLREEIVETATLQSVMDKCQIKPYLIKLDTQGTELSILQSGDLSEVQVILIEVDYVPLYTNQPVFEEIDAYLKGQGFSLFRNSPFTADVRKDGKHVKVGGDAIYVRP